MPAIRAIFKEDNRLEAVLVENNENNLRTTLENEIVIKGSNIYMNTTEYWNSDPMLIAKDKAIYIYTDYDKFEGQAIPGIKVGDGKAYLIDIPFISGNKDAFEDHIRDSTIHVTQEEKDFWNNKISGAMEFLGVTTTQISDGSSTNPIVIAGESVTAKAGDVVIYGSSEYVFSAADNKWHEFGSTGSLKALAFKDSASGSYQPAGSVSKPTFTGTTATISTEYQPAGSVSAPTITVTKQTAAISGITSYTAGSAPAWSATVSSETLTFSWNAGSVTTIGSSSYTVMTGATGSASQPTFTGTTATISASYQPAGSVSQPTFTGTTDTITVS